MLRSGIWCLLVTSDKCTTGGAWRDLGSNLRKYTRDLILNYTCKIMPKITFKTNVEGKINNMPDFKSQALFPIFEAVVNSIHAIEERGDHKSGKIVIEIIRHKGLINPGHNTPDRREEPIKAFYITDNGIGFDKNNYESFLTAESNHKFEKGGKGVGRFYWLKAFDQVEIESIYEENGLKKKRHFDFTKLKNKEIVPKKDDGAIENDGDIGTVIRLKDFKEEYRTLESAYKTGEKIAQRIFEYILSYYIGDVAPRITVKDGENSYYLEQFYENIESYKENIEIETILFTITHLKIPLTYQNVHNIVLCADNRDVLSESVQKYLGTSYQFEDEKTKNTFYYAVYVSSQYLNKNVNSSRLSFDLPREENLAIFLDTNTRQISIDRIKKEVIKRSKEYLAEYLIDVDAKKHDLVSDYITSNPSLRAVPKYCPEIYDEIQVNSTYDTINDVVYLYKGKAELSIQKDHDKLLKKRLNNLSEIKEEAQKLASKMEAFTKDSLVSYILYRKKIIELFENNLERDEEGNFKYEKIIHDIVFPMKTTSDELDIENLNLWLIDELLISHQFATSDIELNKISSLDSAMRPDIFICCEKEPDNSARSISIIEFKRPGSESIDDPVDQLFRIMDQFKTKKKIELKNGRKIFINENTRYYCYAICDLKDDIIRNVGHYGFSELKDNLGYSGYNPKYKANIEVLAFDKILADVKLRHSIFFDTLKISTK